MAIRDWLLERYPGEAHKVVFIPNGVDPALTGIARRGADATLRVVAVGSLIERKGVDLVLGGLARLANPHWHLEVVGSGAELGRLRALARDLGITAQVGFRGDVRPAQIADVLANADVLVLASHSEGRPNVVLEAMAAGLAVVASDIEGTRELLVHGETGLLFADGAADALAAQLARCQADAALRRQLGTAARAWIIDHGLLWSATAERYHDVYRAAGGAG